LDDLQIRLSDPAQYQSIVDAEWNIIYDKLAKCAESGAQIVLSRLAIGDLATQYFADRGIFCAGRVSRIAPSFDLVYSTSVNQMSACTKPAWGGRGATKREEIAAHKRGSQDEKRGLKAWEGPSR
jgi:chaperonin GroEL (HSP60 family)